MAESEITSFDQEQFEAIYPQGVERHYWNRCRIAVITDNLRSIKDAGPMLEVGCGKGLVVSALRRYGFDITGVELAEVEPLQEVAPFVNVNTDALDLDPGIRSGIQTILLLDVIEHLEDPVAFMTRLRSAFPKLRRFIVTVPARQELFSNYDRFNRHFRRYDIPLLRDHAESSMGTVRTAGYFYHALYPAAWIQLRTRGARKLHFTVPAPGVPSFFHRLLGYFFFLEYKVLPSSWRGTSIIAVLDVNV